MNILFVFFTLPHLSKSAMYSDMVNEFQKNGHNVLPMAPIISVSSKSYISIENQIEVLRVKTLDVFSKNVFEKGFANLLLSYQYKKAFALFWKNNTIDLVVVATPSVMFADFISDIKKSKCAKVYLMQKDIFPQNAVDLGLIKNKSIIFKYFKKKECELLSVADIIGCTSQGNINYLLSNYTFLHKNKVQLLYNNSKLFIGTNESNLKVSSNKFKVVFGGNMGKPQQIENVLLLAKKCLRFKDVLFVLIGSGTEVEKHKRTIKELNINNITIINSVTREKYFELLSNCNIGLISLHQNFSVPNTPMKVNDYLNAGLPILASIDRSNDLGEILVQNNIGLYAFADSPDILFEQFLMLYNNKYLRIEMGKNGYEFCLKYLSVEKSYNDIMHQLDNHVSNCILTNINNC